MRRNHGSRRSPEEDPSATDDDELNLVPYLDIITALVIFLIFTFQVVIEFRLIDLIPPAYGQTTGAVEEEPKMTVTLVITRQGFQILSSDDAVAAATIPLVGTTYDTDALHDTLLKWKESYDLSTSIVVMAEDDIEYQAVVDAMDAIRMHEAAWLFPDVLFATLVAGGG